MLPVGPTERAKNTCNECCNAECVLASVPPVNAIPLSSHSPVLLPLPSTATQCPFLPSCALKPCAPLPPPFTCPYGLISSLSFTLAHPATVLTWSVHRYLHPSSPMASLPLPPCSSRCGSPLPLLPRPRPPSLPNQPMVTESLYDNLFEDAMIHQADPRVPFVLCKASFSCPMVRRSHAF